MRGPRIPCDNGSERGTLWDKTVTLNLKCTGRKIKSSLKFMSSLLWVHTELLRESCHIWNWLVFSTCWSYPTGHFSECTCHWQYVQLFMTYSVQVAKESSTAELWHHMLFTTKLLNRLVRIVQNILLFFYIVFFGTLSMTQWNTHKLPRRLERLCCKGLIIWRFKGLQDTLRCPVYLIWKKCRGLISCKCTH